MNQSPCYQALLHLLTAYERFFYRDHWLYIHSLNGTLPLIIISTTFVLLPTSCFKPRRLSTLLHSRCLLEFKHHIVFRWQSDAGSHNVLQSCSLLGQRIHDWCVIWDKWCLSKVRQEGCNWMEMVETTIPVLLELDPAQQLCKAKRNCDWPVQMTRMICSLGHKQA